MFNLTSDEIQAKGANHTASEIFQQPEVWREMISSITENQDSRKQFVDSIYEKHDQVRVIYTGAGTSAFIGDVVVPELRRQDQGKVQFEAIPTTDIVSNPASYFFRDVPTILVSFARSGNSPESLAAVEMGEKLIDHFYQVVITCNKDGELADRIKQDDNAITILTPDKAHDQGLAMTSSFTCMMLAAYSLFSPNGLENSTANRITDNASHLLGKVGDSIDEILAFDFERIVYLGSGMLGQLAHEAALKMLELSGGKVIAMHESSLGFRHGPKSVLNDKSVVVVFLSQDPYTRQYDMDILREVADSDVKVIALTEKEDAEAAELADWTIPVNFGEESLSNDFYLSLLYVIFAQALALKKSMLLGISPDNPSPDGNINRVVQGVTIYDYVK